MGEWEFYAGLSLLLLVLQCAAFLVLVGWTPLEALNRVLRHLRIPYSVWRLRGKWFMFRDEPGSLTPVIVAGEIRRGLYDVKFHPGETVVDLGAHIGMFSIPLAKANPLVRFWAYEPNPRTYANLQRNIRLNRTWNVVAINEGLAPTTCRLASENIQWNTGGQRSRPSDQGVPGRPIWDILAQHPATVLKIDVEGAEYGAIQDDDFANVECVIMEVHGHLGDPAPILEACKRAGGYMVQVIEDPALAGVYRDGVRFPEKTRFGKPLRG